MDGWLKEVQRQPLLCVFCSSLAFRLLQTLLKFLPRPHTVNCDQWKSYKWKNLSVSLVHSLLTGTWAVSWWDTAGQERFKCVASTYYRGAQAIIVVFDLSNYYSLDHARQWLEDAMIDNDPSSVLLFLVGTKKDLSHPDVLDKMEQEAIRFSEEIRAEYWAVSALSGESVRDFFFRVASLTFEARVLAELERNNNKQSDGIVKITDHDDKTSKKKQANCCN
ncbi:ras-related protein Rab-34 isoform X1 [Tachysurus ichikawai]